MPAYYKPEPTGSPFLDAVRTNATLEPADLLSPLPLGAVLRGVAGPGIKAAFKYMEARYPRILSKISDVYAISPRAQKRIYQKEYGYTDPPRALGFAPRESIPPVVYLTRKGRGEKVTTEAVAEYIDTLAHETAHVLQDLRPGLMRRGQGAYTLSRKVPPEVREHIMLNYPPATWLSEGQAWRIGKREGDVFLRGLKTGKGK